MRRLSIKSARGCAWGATLVLAACSNQQEPAAVLLGDIQSTVMTAAPSAEKYAKAELADVQHELLALQADFDKQDYESVLRTGPAVFTQAQTLLTTSAAKQMAVAGELNDQWNRLATTVPGEIERIQERLQAAGAQPAERTAAANLHALWSKAQGAFAAGNIHEAVDTANDVHLRADALSAAIERGSPRSR